MHRRTFVRFVSALMSLLACLACVTQAASAGVPTFHSVPDILRPGKSYSFIFNAPYDGYASLTLQDDSGETACTITEGYPVSEGENTVWWDGLDSGEEPAPTGEYTLVLAMDDGSSVSAPLRVGVPMPLLTQVTQNESLIDDEPLIVSYNASENGTLFVTLIRSDGDSHVLGQTYARQGAGSFQWDGTVDGMRAEDGNYALVLVLQAENGQSSMANYLWVDLVHHASQLSSTEPAVQDVPVVETSDSTVPAQTAPQKTPPYSSDTDGISFWSLSPGETDDELIWKVLTQPITVYTNASDTGHTYLMENPDGTGAQIAQIHGKSQGLHIIGEVNEHGWVLAEAFSNYDPSYLPADQNTAYDLRRGYVKASGLKTIEVSQKYGIVVDILAQRLYLYIDGERVTELVISTGKLEPGKPYNETIAGEFITVSRTGGFWSGNMFCDMALRINGGILIHEVPCKINADGTRNYSSFEGYLGTVQSHGCIRVQRKKNADGYSHTWLWKNIPLNTKVLVWSRYNRLDTPVPKYPNPTP